MLGEFRRLIGRRRAKASPAPLPDEIEAVALPEGLGEQIEAAQNLALEIYRQHGLPTEDGSYVRRGPHAQWEKLPDNLTPTEKWELLNEAPIKAGWRFVVRAGIGRHSEFEDVQRAAYLLTACDGLADKLKGHSPTTPQDVVEAMQLASATAWLNRASAISAASSPEIEAHKPLTFLPVASVKPAPKRKPKKP